MLHLVRKGRHDETFSRLRLQKSEAEKENEESEKGEKGLDMETYEYVPCDADFDVLPIVVEEGSSDGVDPEESVPPHPLLSDADEAIEVANVMALDNPDGGIVGGAECDAEGKNEEVGEAESGEADSHMGEAVKEVEYNAKAEE
ncbi:hypothetical protein DAPPUDRAFT_270638 [Daphnia pulex]|uniref:Uncharacterized protein n=1 Tax=Daphnia pulex TaxID=6669 RepID=E9I120_DAPPU|nr:hypothetical protein DAPPUDRAFT_270638 [Daphnia pulex]|eukprot:EFX62310.1 hypothetical protein DAPPUDRAFT_270638 [Daphnia pulex]